MYTSQLNATFRGDQPLDKKYPTAQIHSTTQSPNSRQDVPPSQDFEWIQHGDASARRRVRAHVTRVCRRQIKAAQRELTEGAKVNKRGSESPDAKIEEVASLVATGTCISIPHPKGKADARAIIQVLRPSLGSGRTDPFASLPIQLSPKKSALLDHFFLGVAPSSYTLDSRANFQYVKTLCFNVARPSISALHVILSVAANDIAVLHGKQDSEDAIMHRSVAIGLVNKQLVQWKSSPTDENLSSVALLAGNEDKLLFGTSQDFNTHMDGLSIMLQLRGGLEVIRVENPQLYSIIVWFDYSGSCNLLSRRRFGPPQANDNLQLRSDPPNIPEPILNHLPAKYDLYEEITSTFAALQTITAALRSEQPSNSQRLDTSGLVSQIDSDLYRSICAPKQEGNRSRRQHILQTFQLVALIYTAIVSENLGPLTVVYLSRLENLLNTEVATWGTEIVSLFRLIMGNDRLLPDVYAVHMGKLIDSSIPLNWESWRAIKMELLTFFVYDDACSGKLRGLWKHRIFAINN